MKASAVALEEMVQNGMVAAESRASAVALAEMAVKKE